MAQTGGPARLGYPMEGLQTPQLTVFSGRAHRILLAKLVEGTSITEKFILVVCSIGQGWGLGDALSV